MDVRIWWVLITLMLMDERSVRGLNYIEMCHNVGFLIVHCNFCILNSDSETEMTIFVFLVANRTKQFPIQSNVHICLWIWKCPQHGHILYREPTIHKVCGPYVVISSSQTCTFDCYMTRVDFLNWCRKDSWYIQIGLVLKVHQPKLRSIVDTTLHSLKIKNHMRLQHTLKTPYIQVCFVK